MDWNRTIERHHLPLMRIVSALVALLVSSRIGGVGMMIPRHVWRSILFVLRPAEAAVRRLIILAAIDLPRVPFVVGGRALRIPQVSPECSGTALTVSADCSVSDVPVSDDCSGSVVPPLADVSSTRRPAISQFQLFDPLKRFDLNWNDDEALFDADRFAASDDAEPDDTPVSARHLNNRLLALCMALSDLPKQAARLARFYGRRDALLKANRPSRWSPDRPGLPPGWRTRNRHDIDAILKECHQMVRIWENSS